MPAQSNPTRWRTSPYRSQGYLFLLAPKIVFQARVDQTQFNYPLAGVAYNSVTTGSISNVRAGMTVLFGSSAGKSDLGRQRVRATPTGATLFMGWSSRGQRDGEVFLADGAYITILDDYRIWTKTPRISKSGQSFKDYSLQPGNFGAYTPPVANGGVGMADFVSPATGHLRVRLYGSNSFATTPGATVVSYLWEVGDGSFVEGDATTANPLLDFPPGFRWVHLTVTDTVGKAHTCHIPVFAAEKTGENAPFTQVKATRTLRPEGTEATFEIRQDVPETTYPDGTLVMYWEHERYGDHHGSLEGPAGRQHMKFIGWHQSDGESVTANELGIEKGTTISCVGPAGRLQVLPGFPQVVERASSPKTWQEMKHADINRYVQYILLWHSTVLELTEFTPAALGPQYPFPALESDGAALYQQADSRAQAIGHRLTCDSRGRLFIQPDPMEFDTVDRTGVVMASLQPADYSGYHIMRRSVPRAHWLNGKAIIAEARDALSANVIPVFSIAPGDAPGMGLSNSTRNYQLVRSQDELNRRTGHQYARLNSTTPPFRVSLTRGGDGGIEPAYMEWVQFPQTGTQQTRRGRKFVTERFLPQEVQITHDNERSSNDVIVTVEPEVVGTPGVTFIPPEINWPAWPDPQDVWPVIDWGDDFFDGETLEELADDLGVEEALLGFALTWTGNDKVARTFTLTSEEVLWEDVTGIVSGTVCDCAGKMSGADLPAWLVTFMGTTGTVYACTDILAETLTWTVEHTFEVSGSGFDGALRIAASQTADLIAVAWLTGEGVTVMRRVDGNWGAAAKVGSTGSTDANAAGRYLGLAVDGTKVLVSALSANDTHKLYMADSGGAFSAVGNLPFNSAINAIQPDGYGNTIISINDGTYTETTESGTFDWFQTQCASDDRYCFVDSAEVLEAEPADGQVAVPNQTATLEKRWHLNSDAGPVDALSWVLVFERRKTCNQTGGSSETIQWEVEVIYDGGTFRDEGDLLYSQATVTTGPDGSWNGDCFPKRHRVQVDVLGNFDAAGKTIQSIRLRATWDGFETHEHNWDSPTQPDQYFHLTTETPELTFTYREYDSNHLYRVTDYATSPVYNDITPEGGLVPHYHYGIAVDKITVGNLSLAAQAEANLERLLTSDLHGATWAHWTQDGIIWVKEADTLFIVGGGDFRMSVEGASAEFVSREGDFREAVGEHGGFLGAIVIFAVG